MLIIITIIFIIIIIIALAIISYTYIPGLQPVPHVLAEDLLRDHDLIIAINNSYH